MLPSRADQDDQEGYDNFKGETLISRNTENPCRLPNNKDIFNKWWNCSVYQQWVKKMQKRATVDGNTVKLSLYSAGDLFYTSIFLEAKDWENSRLRNPHKPLWTIETQSIEESLRSAVCQLFWRDANHLHSIHLTT